jgi:hypothetical protein
MMIEGQESKFPGRARQEGQFANYTHDGYNKEGAMAGMTRSNRFQFVEAPAFSRHREEYLDDEGFRQLQRALALNPESGDLIPGAGGVRKLRWADFRRGKGKRGGLRIVYYCFLLDEEIWLLTLYGKDEASDLSKDEKAQLKRALEAERAARKKREMQ